MLGFIDMNVEDNVKQRYKGEEGKKYHETKRFIPDSAYPWVARLRVSKIAPYVTEDDRVLEYGVGFGWNLALLKCERRLGFDLSEFIEPVVRKHGIEFVHDPAIIPVESIDVVVCHHMLEHTIDPPEVLREIGRILRPRGKLLLFVPYEKEKRYHRYDPKEPNHHLYSWNVQTLGNLVEDTGFNVMEGKLGRFGYDRFAAVWAARLRLGEFGFRFLRKAIHLVKPGFEVQIVAERS